MWNTTGFEAHLKERLIGECGAERGETHFAAYSTTRSKLVTDIYGAIAGAEPQLSDHGADHIANVQDNVFSLLSSEQPVHGLSSMDLYCLGMMILFHDVGNLFGRENHHKKIGEAFDWARGTDASVRHEKTLIIRAAAAHTGLATDGTHDTLKEVSPADHLHGRSIQLQSLSAILRLADELAEGPQRTSEFRRRMGLIALESRIFHEYASIVHVFADRPNERIAVTLEIEVKPSTDETRVQRDADLQSLLQFALERVHKLDQERRYARFYSDILLPFKSTRLTMNFHSGGTLLPLDLPTLQLDDKVVPGDPGRSLAEIDGRFDAAKLRDEVVALTVEAHP